MGLEPGLLLLLGILLLGSGILLNASTRYQLLSAKNSDEFQEFLRRDSYAERLVQRWEHLDWILATAGFLWITLAFAASWVLP